MAATDPKTYHLSELANFIRRVFALNLPQAIWVSAEIGQANTSRGNCWLTLVEKQSDSDAVTAQLDAVVWQRQLTALQRKHGIKLIRDLFKDGMSVRLKVTTAFHPRYGLRLVVEEIDPTHTLGELERRRQLTLERLAAEKLLRKNGRRPLPAAPLRLAVISSDTAAGLADFRAQLEGNPYGYRFDARLFPAAMQGGRTGPEVISRLRQIQQWPETFDAVVIIRGGGGKTDLAAFDDEDLARSVANYPIPVLSGIGHETDAAVLDAVAHTSLKTPTAAAVFLIERVAAAESRLLHLGRDINRVAGRILYHEAPRLERIRSGIRHAARLGLNSEQQRITRLATETSRLPLRILGREGERINNLETLLSALRPETTLARGFSLVSQEGRLITAAGQIQPGELEIRFREGRSRVVEVERGKGESA